MAQASRSRRTAKNKAVRKRTKPKDKRARRRGLPVPQHVIEVIPFTPVEGKPFRILRTTEIDRYDPPIVRAKRTKKRPPR